MLRLVTVIFKKEFYQIELNWGGGLLGKACVVWKRWKGHKIRETLIWYCLTDLDVQVFPSEMMQAVFGDRDTTVDGALPKSIQPLGRAGRDEEMAGTILYFASEAGGYCSGTIHVVDGGRLGLQPGATYWLTTQILRNPLSQVVRRYSEVVPLVEWR